MDEEIQKINQYIKILDITEQMFNLIPNAYIDLKELNKVKLSINNIKGNLFNNLILLNKDF